MWSVSVAALGLSIVTDGDGTIASRRALATAIFDEGFNQQHFDNINLALAGYTLHVAGTSLSLRPGDLERMVAEWHAGFSGFHFAVHQVIAEGDFVAVRATLHGVHDGVWRDKPPTGLAHSSEHMFFFRFEGTQIVEVWELNDPTGLP